jgi:hypothetical protein
MAASERVASPRELNKHSRTPIARAIGSNLDRSVSPPGQTFETSICFWFGPGQRITPAYQHVFRVDLDVL